MRHAAEGLPDTYVNVLFSTEDSLWAGTRQGLARYDVVRGTLGADVVQRSNCLSLMLLRTRFPRWDPLDRHTARFGKLYDCFGDLESY